MKNDSQTVSYDEILGTYDVDTESIPIPKKLKEALDTFIDVVEAVPIEDEPVKIAENAIPGIDMETGEILDDEVFVEIDDTNEVVPDVVSDTSTDEFEYDERRRIAINEVMNETPKAWLLDTELGTDWFPKSKCSVQGKVLFIPEWLYVKKF